MQDIAVGRPVLFIQTRGTWGKLLTQLMADRFTVTVEHTSDITTEAELSFRAGYNEITEAHIDRVFGAGSCKEVYDEVLRFRLEQYRRFLNEGKNKGPA